MKSCIAVTIFVALVTLVSFGQAASVAAAQPTMAAAAARSARHGTFTVELTKSLDSRKLKQGDTIVAILTGGITLPDEVKIPRGAQVIGHIVEAKSRSKQDPKSSLQMTFDKLIGPGNRAIPILTTVRALAPNPNANLTTGTMADAYGINLADVTTRSVVNTLTPPPIPLLNDESTGVLGFSDLQLGPNGTLVSTGKDVKLDRGTRILLNVMMQ